MPDIQDIDGGADVLTESETKLEKPKLFKVLLHNDDFTTMEFVIWVLEYVFQKPQTEAFAIMLKVHNQGVGIAGDDCGCAYKTDHDKSNGEQSIAYTNSVVKPDERKYLRNLPSHIRLEYNLTGEKFNLLMVHGSPRKINEYLFVDREEKSFLRILEQADAHIMFFGHTHKPYHRIFKDDSNKYRHAINIGSVGKPKDGDPRGCYVMLMLDESFSLTNPESLKVEFIRFEYDTEKAAKAVEDSPLPNDFADMLRKGY